MKGLGVVPGTFFRQDGIGKNPRAGETGAFTLNSGAALA